MEIALAAVQHNGFAHHNGPQTRVHFPDVLLFLCISNNLKFSYFYYYNSNVWEKRRGGHRDEPFQVNARS